MTFPINLRQPEKFSESSITTVEKNSVPKFSIIVPSIHDPHPSVKIEELPSTVQHIVKKVKMVDLNLLEIFYTQTHCDLTELAILVPAIDFDSIYMQFSIILSLAKTADMIPKSSEEKGEIFGNQLKEKLCFLLPELPKNLLQFWRETLQQIPNLTRRMGMGKKSAVETQCRRVSEAFDYLAELLSKKKCQFEIFNTSSIHIEQPEDKEVRPQNEWLGLMLRYTQAACKWYDRHPHFWTMCDFHEDTTNYSKRLDLLQKLIRRRLNSNNFSPGALARFHYHSLSAHLNKIGNMHSYALTIFNTFPQEQIIESMGWSESIGRLTERPGFEKESALIYQLLIPSCFPEVVKLDGKRIAVLQAIQSASIADAMKSSRIKIKADILQAIIQEADNVSLYFKNIKNDVANCEVFSIGIKQFSFADMGVHIEHIAKILEELADSPDENAAAILFTLHDLKGSVCDCLNQGVELILKTLQETYRMIESDQARGKAINPELVDKVVGDIECVTEMMTSLGSTSPKLNKLINELIEGTPAQNNKRERKRKGKRKRNVKHKRPVSRKEQTTTNSLPDEQNRVKTEKQEPFTDPEEEIPLIIEDEPGPKETVSITEATQILRETTAKLQSSLAEAAKEDDLSEKAYSIRNVKWRTLCKELANAGFILKRSSGSHHHYQHPEAKEVGIATVPINSKNCLSTGVVKNVRSQIERARYKN